MRTEEGISLVEVLVSIVLLGLVMSALGATLTNSMASARQNESQTHATALATEKLESLQALHWSKLGFYGTDANFVATPAGLGGLPTRSFGAAPNPRDAAVPLPWEQLDRDGRTYTITTDIVEQQV